MVRMPGSCAQDITAEKREDPREEVPVDSRLEAPDSTCTAMDRQDTIGSSLVEVKTEYGSKLDDADLEEKTGPTPRHPKKTKSAPAKSRVAKRSAGSRP